MLPQPQGSSVQPSISAPRSLPGFKPTASRLAHLGLMLVPDAITALARISTGLSGNCRPARPCTQLSNMEARTVFELLLARGWRIMKVKTDD